MKKIISKSLFAAVILIGSTIGAHSVFAATTLSVTDITFTIKGPTTIDFKTTINFVNPAKSGPVSVDDLRLAKIKVAHPGNLSSAPVAYALDESSTKFFYNTPVVYNPQNLGPLVRTASYLVYVHFGSGLVKSSASFIINNSLQPTATFAPITVVQSGTTAKVTTTLTYKTNSASQAIMTGRDVDVTDGKVRLLIEKEGGSVQGIPLPDIDVYDKIVTLPSVSKFFTARTFTVSVPGLDLDKGYIATFFEESYDAESEEKSFVMTTAGSTGTGTGTGTGNYSNTTVEFLDGSLAINTVTDKTFKISGKIKFTDPSISSSTVAVPTQYNLVGEATKSGSSTVVCQPPIDSHNPFMYNVVYDITFTCGSTQVLQPSTDYLAKFLEKTKNISSETQGVKTKASGTGTGTGTVSTKFAIGNTVKVTATTLNVRSTANGTTAGTQAKDATGTVVDGPTAAGGYNWWKIDYSSGTDGWSIENSLEKCATATTCGSSGTGTGTGTNPPNTASGNTHFSGTSITYPATSIAGALTPTITPNTSNPNANTLVLNGEITYSAAVGNPNIANISRMGKLIFRLTDGNNRAAGEQIVQIGGGTTLEYDVPYRFSTTFGSFDIGSNGGAPTKLPAPFKLQIIEDGLNAKTGQLTVVNPPLVTIRGADEPKNSTATGANGVSVTFNFTKGLVDEAAKKVDMEGTLTYSRALTGNEQADKVGEIIATVYDSVGTVYKTNPFRITRLDPAGKTIEISLTLDNIDPAKTVKFIAKDNDFTISSDLFTFDRQVPVSNAQLAALYAAQSATKDGTTVTLTDPTITAGSTATSIVATGSIKYDNSTKTGTMPVPDAKVVAKLYSLDSQGNLVDNNAAVPVTTTANYNQPATLTATINNLDAAKKYAFQFTDTNYAPAKSSAKVIESKDGKFVESTNQPANTGSGNNNQNPAAPSGGRGTLGSPLKDGLDSIPGIVGILVDDVVIPIAIPLLALAIMYTGFLFVKAKGNATALEEAKKALKWTLIGGAIILASKVIALALQSTIADIVRNP